MQQDSNIIKFERNRLFKSKILSYFIATINVTAQVVLLFNTIDYIIAYFFKNWDITLGYYNLTELAYGFLIALILQFLFIEMSYASIDTANKIIKIRNLNTHLIPIKKSILDITKVEISQKEYNLMLYFKKKKKLRISIKECNKFVTLLQELNPSIEVEYKE